MAHAVVSGVVSDMVSRAISFLAGRLQGRPDVERKLRRLRHLVVKLESVADAAGARRITSRALLAGAHRGRYFLDAFQGDELELVDDGRGEVQDRSLFLPSSSNPALRVAARRLLLRDGVLAGLESFSGDLAEFIMLLQGFPPAVHRPLATNIYADSQMFGRHVERRRVIDFLLHDDDGDGGDEPAGADLGVLPIIGRAGLGKSTLVQHVCGEPAVRRRFSLIMLLDFHGMSLTAAGETAQPLRSLFSADARKAGPSLAAVGDLLSLLELKLRGQMFLAVFDNVDQRRKQVIRAIMPALRRGRRGSRVIVTGSDRHVADLGTAGPVVLRPLPPAEYWFFFKAHAFGGEADPGLAAAGQAIAKRLRGSFLGAKIVGALLRSRPEPRVWRSVLAGSHADPSWLGVAAAASSLLPPHVTVRGVAVSGSPVGGVVGLLQDAFLTTPPHDGGRRRRELPLLLCKSVFTFFFFFLSK
ncbi:hypothetical protein ACP70R_042968 [Stipagrostis hirtigluma subsp. patula]